MLISTILSVLVAASHTGGDVTDVRDNVRKGLKWLAAQQQPDGTWSGNNNSFTTLTTAYAGLAFLMEGSTASEGAYAVNVAKAVAWYEKIARPSGLLVPADDANEQLRYLQGHTAAMLFLASAYDTDNDPARRKRLEKILSAAVKYAAEAQSPQGGWGFGAAREGNNFSESGGTAFMVQALRAAESAGMDVPRQTLDKAARYFASATHPRGGIVYGLGNGYDARAGDGQPFQTAAAAAAYLAADRRPPLLAGWVNFARQSPPYLPRVGQPAQRDQMNSYTLQQHLALARLTHTLGEGGHRALEHGRPEAELLRWSDQREPLYQYLAASQNREGYWPDASIGNSYSTALALILLQLENNYLPAFSR